MLVLQLRVPFDEKFRVYENRLGKSQKLGMPANPISMRR